jgi:hypothetical protein
MARIVLALELLPLTAQIESALVQLPQTVQIA